MPQPFINPNYLNAYPNAYPYQPQMQPPMDRLQQLQAPYQMPQQTQVPQVPQTNQGILWVQGEAGATINGAATVEVRVCKPCCATLSVKNIGATAATVSDANLVVSRIG